MNLRPILRRNFQSPLPLFVVALVAALIHVTSLRVRAQQPVLERADSILVFKKDHRLELLSAGKVIRSYSVALGRGGLAPKLREADGRTPEGSYVIDKRNASSKYHLALHISYPNQEDRNRAAAQGASPGGDIMIHGLPNGMGWLGSTHRTYDWTNGCIAVTDSEIEEIWMLVPVGTRVEIRP